MTTEEATRPVRMSPELMERFASRSSEGYLLTWDWGAPDEEGFYTPTVTTHGDDRLVPEITEERLAEVLKEYDSGRIEVTVLPGNAVPVGGKPRRFHRAWAAALLAALATPVTPEGGEPE